MSINDRFKELRKSLGISQEEFGKKIGLSKSGISNIESGTRNVTDKHIKLVCSEFPVNEEWLKTGEGEMEQRTSPDVLKQMTDRYGLPMSAYVMIEKFINLPPEGRNAVLNYFREIDMAISENNYEIHNIDATLAEMDPYAPAYAGTEPPQPMNKLMGTVGSQQKEDASSEISAEQAEAAYIKKISELARKEESTASNTTPDTRKLSNE